MQIEIEEQLIKRIEELHPDYELARISGDLKEHAELITAYVNVHLQQVVRDDERRADQGREMRWYGEEGW